MPLLEAAAAGAAGIAWSLALLAEAARLSQARGWLATGVAFQGRAVREAGKLGAQERCMHTGDHKNNDVGVKPRAAVF